MISAMMESVIFDCDGVIVESAEIKTQAFACLFSGYPDHIDAIVAFHKKNVGLSRFVKFRHIYKELLKEQLSEEREQYLGEKFSEIVLQQILDAPLVKGVREFLMEEEKRLLFFVVSGTPHDELNYLILKKGLAPFFQEVIGTPTTKPEAISYIISRYSLCRENIVMVGDGLSDQEAARLTGIGFVARITNENQAEFKSYSNCIQDLTELRSGLERLKL
ncbi:MAG: HAD family hydrolase [Magnetococcales bacterium]|nr:HAD family hydrolase [Magnetococcales bacterium]